jgi:hypothetical protein
MALMLRKVMPPPPSIGVEVDTPFITANGARFSHLGSFVESASQKAMYGYVIEVEAPNLCEGGYLIFVPIGKEYAVRVVRTAEGK